MVIVSVVGRDEPGIIAAISRTLYGLECNLADVSMSVLNGRFAMVLALFAPEQMPVARLEEELREAASNFDLLIAARELREREDVALKARQDNGARALIRLYGADKPGLVCAVTSLLAETRSNIVDLRTQRSEGPSPLYSLFLEVNLAPQAGFDELERRLAAVARENRVEISIQNLTSAEL